MHLPGWSTIICIAFQDESEGSRQQRNRDLEYNQGRHNATSLVSEGPDSAPATIKIKALQAMYVEESFTPPALPYCFGTKAKKQDVPLVHIQEIGGFQGVQSLHKRRGGRKQRPSHGETGVSL